MLRLPRKYSSSAVIDQPTNTYKHIHQNMCFIYLSYQGLVLSKRKEGKTFLKIIGKSTLGTRLPYSIGETFCVMGGNVVVGGQATVKRVNVRYNSLHCGYGYGSKQVRLYVACTAWVMSGYTNKREGLSKVSLCKTRLARKRHFGLWIYVSFSQVYTTYTKASHVSAY